MTEMVKLSPEHAALMNNTIDAMIAHLRIAQEKGLDDNMIFGVICSIVASTIKTIEIDADYALNELEETVKGFLSGEIGMAVRQQ